MTEITSSAPVRAAIRLFFPFRTENFIKFRKKLYSNPLWLTEDTESCFYLKYIDRIFNKSGVYSDCLIMKKDFDKECGTVRSAPVSLSSARIFSFDTSAAFIELKFTAECSSLSEVADISALLRLSNRNIYETEGGELKSPNSIALETVSQFGRAELFDHLSPCGETRAELFVSVVLENNIACEEADSAAFNIASGYNGKYNGEADEKCLYNAFPYIRWAVTDKGVCVIGMKPGEEKNRKFIGNVFPSHADKRYIVWFIIALHQKYALYRYMNGIAERSSAGNLNIFRRKIMELNTKYRFSIISEETGYQRLYEMMCKSRKLDSEFADIDGEIERISEFYEAEGQKNTTRAMTLLSILCGFSLVIDICNLIFGGESNIFYAVSGFAVLLILMLTVIMPRQRIRSAVRSIRRRVLSIFHRE